MFRLPGSCPGAVVAALFAGAVAGSAAAAEPDAAAQPGPPVAIVQSPAPLIFPLGVLIERLDGETRAGRLAWHETGRARSFVVPFDGYTVEISAVLRPRADFPEYIMSWNYVIRIYDAGGRAVVDASDMALDSQLGPRNASFFPVMGDMWAGARRTVLGTDRAIASIQGQLDARRCGDGRAPAGLPPSEGASSSQPCS